MHRLTAAPPGSSAVTDGGAPTGHQSTLQEDRGVCDSTPPHKRAASVIGTRVRPARLPAPLFALVVVVALCAVVVVGGILADHVPTLLILACLAVFGVLAFVREEGRL